MRDVTRQYREAVNSVSGEVPVVLLTIDHPDLVAPIRVNNSGVDIDSRGDTYIALSFEITPPSDIEDSVSTAQLSMDNMTRDLVEWLEITNGGQGTTALIEVVLFGTPDVVEWTFDMALSDVSISMTTLTGYLTFPDLVNLPAVGLRYDIRTAKGLF